MNSAATGQRPKLMKAIQRSDDSLNERTQLYD